MKFKNKCRCKKKAENLKIRSIRILKASVSFYFVTLEVIMTKPLLKILYMCIKVIGVAHTQSI